MIYTELAEGQYCGLACIGKENYLIWYRQNRTAKTIFVIFEKDGIIKQKETISGEDIYLRLEADAKENNYQFLASQDGKIIQRNRHFFQYEVRQLERCKDWTLLL